MTSFTRHFRTDRLARVLLAAIALVIGLGWPGQASASSAISAQATDETETHPHNCKCGKHCGHSCCCDPDKKATPKPKSTPVEKSPRDESGPCLNSAPCQDSGLPNTPTAGPFGKVATIVIGALVFSDDAGRLLPSDLDCILPPRLPSRLDDPPDRSDLA